MTEGILTDKKLQRVLEQQRRRLHEREVADLGDVLSTPAGRRWYHRLVFETCRVLQFSYDPSVKDGICAGQHQAHLDGQRSIGGLLLTEAQRHWPDLWLKTLEEAIAQDRADRAERDQATKSAGDQNG